MAWSYGLLRETGKVLLDAEMVQARITDLPVWRVGRGKFACIVALESASPMAPEYFKTQLRVQEELVHITLEVSSPAAQHGTRLS